MFAICINCTAQHPYSYLFLKFNLQALEAIEGSVVLAATQYLPLKSHM